MKSKPILVSAVLILAVLAPILSCKKKPPQDTPGAPAAEAAAAKEAPVPGNEQEAPETVPPLELLLTANGEESLTITRDTPLVLSLTIANRAAAEAVNAREARETLKEELEAQVREQSMTRERADWVLKREPESAAVVSVTLVVDSGGFSFAFGREGAPAALPWTLKPVAPASPQTLSLDDRTDAGAVFVAAADASKLPPLGEFEISAAFEARSRDGKSWSGKLRSNPVAVTIVEEAKTPGEKAERSLAFAEYYLKIGDLERAGQGVEAALAEFPTLIRGLCLRGTLLEAKGDFRAALESYQRARVGYRRMFPQSSPPWGLNEGVQRMLDKLGIKVPEIID